MFKIRTLIYIKYKNDEERIMRSFLYATIKVF